MTDKVDHSIRALALFPHDPVAALAFTTLNDYADVTGECPSCGIDVERTEAARLIHQERCHWLLRDAFETVKEARIMAATHVQPVWLRAHRHGWTKHYVRDAASTMCGKLFATTKPQWTEPNITHSSWYVFTCDRCEVIRRRAEKENR